MGEGHSDGQSDSTVIEVDEETLSFVGTLPIRQSWFADGFATHDTHACPELSFGGRRWLPLFTARFPRMTDEACGYVTFARLKMSRTAVAAFLPGSASIGEGETSLLLGLLPLCQQMKRKLNLLLIHAMATKDKPEHVILAGMKTTLASISPVVDSILVVGDNEPLARVATEFETGEPRALEGPRAHLFPCMKSCMEWAERRDKEQEKVSENLFNPTCESSPGPIQAFRENLDLLNLKTSSLDPFRADELLGWRYLELDIPREPTSPKGSSSASVRFVDADEPRGEKGSQNEVGFAKLDTETEALEAISEDGEEEEDESLVESFKHSRSKSNGSYRTLQFNNRFS